MKAWRLTIFLAVVAVPLLARGADVPATDIWLVSLADDHTPVGEPRQLTIGGSYDNQPYFAGEHQLLFTSMDEKGQTDIWKLDLDGNKAERLLQTPESEYSPVVTPDGGIAVVRVSLDGVQQLWQLPPGGSHYELVFPDLKGVGYQAWLGGGDVALFLVVDPPELHIANRNTGKVTVLAKDIGRCLQAAPDGSGDIYFVEPGAQGGRWIKRLHRGDKRLEAIAPVLDDSEDFVVMQDGGLLMAGGKTLFRWDGKSWQALATFATLPGPITRLALDPSMRKLAFVAAEHE